MIGQRRQVLFLVMSVVAWLQTDRTSACNTIRKNMKLVTGKVDYIESPNYPTAYPGTAEKFEFIANAPVDHKVAMFCDHFDVEYTRDCVSVWFAWSRTGDAKLNDAQYFCGRLQNLTLETDGNLFAAKFENHVANLRDNTGFHCFVQAAPIASMTTVSPSLPATTIITTSTTTQTTTSTTTQPTTIPSALPLTSPPPKEKPCSCGVKGDKPPPGTGGRSHKIVGGTRASVNEYPWIVALTTARGYQFCGGSLIDSEWILTASHCVARKSPSSIRVVLGEHDFLTGDESPSFISSVAKIILHESYNAQTVDNDIALLRLVSPVKYSETVAPVCMPYRLQDSRLRHKMVTVAGWGTTASGGYASKTLLEVDLPILTTSECREFSIVAPHLTDNMICTYEAGKDSCQGDSGGPLTFHSNGTSYQVGIVSWGFGCAHQNKPGVYTKLSNYLTWINKKIGKTLCTL